MSEKYFTVHVNCTIQGQTYRHGVCYPLRESLVRLVQKMAVDGMATIYLEEMRIVSGVAYPMRQNKKQGQADKAVSAPSPSKAGSVVLAPASYFSSVPVVQSVPVVHTEYATEQQEVVAEFAPVVHTEYAVEQQEQTGKRKQGGKRGEG